MSSETWTKVTKLTFARQILVQTLHHKFTCGQADEYDLTTESLLCPLLTEGFTIASRNIW
jgi:hypothetical protein